MAKLYYETKLGKLWHGNCLDVMSNIDYVDMVITDPPYGVNYMGGHFNPNREKIQNDDVDMYANAIPLILKITPGPCYCFFADSKAYNIYSALNKENADIHALLIWNKTNATYAAMNAQYKQRHESILYFKRKGGHTKWIGKSTESTILNFNRPAANKLHPTQKPVDLLCHLISNHDVNSVLDPFLGSGSTAMACERMKLRWIGIELNEEYCEIAAKRIDDELAQLKLFSV